MRSIRDVQIAPYVPNGATACAIKENKQRPTESMLWHLKHDTYGIKKKEEKKDDT